MKHCLLAIIFALGFHLSLCAQDVPEKYTQGFEKLIETNSITDAMSLWLKGSILENDSTTRIKIAGGYTALAEAYGKTLSYDSVKVVAISPKVMRIYAVINMEKGAVFTYCDFYDNGTEWIMLTFQFNTKVNKVFPSSLYSN